MIHWVDQALALAIHDRQLAEHGGQSGVRDESLLDSALVRPQQRFRAGKPPADLAVLAASLAYGLVCNHPFVDGNKRTAHVAYRTFLLLNGADLMASQQDMYLRMVVLAEGSLSAAEFADWLRAHIAPKPDDSVQDKASGVHKSAAA